jgi:hypothetical protein
MSEFKNNAGSDGVENAKKTLSKEHAKLWEPVAAADMVLQIDYDIVIEHAGIPAPVKERFFETLKLLEQRFDGKRGLTYECSLSRNSRLHVVVHLPNPLTVIERIAWQAAFGSDGKREALCLLSVANGVKNPIVLFQRKDRPASYCYKSSKNTEFSAGRKFREE